MRACRMCWGEGVTMDDHFERNKKACPVCKGRGWLDEDRARELGLRRSRLGSLSSRLRSCKMRVKELWNGEIPVMDAKDATDAYNLEAGLQGLDHWAYVHGGEVMVIKHFSGVEILSPMEVVDKVREFRLERLGGVRV